MFELLREEHRAIADSVRRMHEDLIAKDTALRQRDARRIAPTEVERSLEELGLFGELDADFMDTSVVHSIVAYDSGRACLPYPLMERLAARYFQARNANLAPGSKLVFAVVASLADDVSSRPLLDRGFLSGTVSGVPFADICGGMIVWARGKSAAGRDDSVLVEVEMSKAGVRGRASVEPDYPIYDVTFDNAACGNDRVCGELRDGRKASEALELHCALLAAAEMAGVGERMIEMTKEHLLVRSQFGVPLGSNQVLKHRLADHYVNIEALKSAVTYAAAAVDANAEDAAVAARAAKVFAGKIGKPLAEDMLQMHGAIGYTTEYPLHLYMRRMFRLAVSFGSSYEQGEKLFDEFRKVA